MFQRLVANWLRQYAQEAFVEGLGRDESSESKPVEPSDVVVFFPTAAEAGGLVDQLTGSTMTKCHGFMERRGHLKDIAVTVVEAPVDQERLAKLVQSAIRLLQPDWVIAGGFCVALKDRLKRGDMLMAEEVIDGAGYSLKTGLQIDPQSLPQGVHFDTLQTTSAAGTEADEHSSEAIAFDQQAMIVAEVCRLEKTKMLSVHVVAGHAGARAAVVEQMSKQSSLVAKLGAATGALLEQPENLKHLLKDKEHTLRLSDRLAIFLVGVIEQIAEGSSQTGTGSEQS